MRQSVESPSRLCPDIIGNVKQNGEKARKKKKRKKKKSKNKKEDSSLGVVVTPSASRLSFVRTFERIPVVLERITSRIRFMTHEILYRIDRKRCRYVVRDKRILRSKRGFVIVRKDLIVVFRFVPLAMSLFDDRGRIAHLESLI